MVRSNKIWNGQFKGVFYATILLVELLISIFFNRIKTYFFLKNIGRQGKNVKIGMGFFCRYPSCIEIGDNVVIGEKTKFTTEFTDNHFIILNDNSSIGESCCIDFSGGLILGKESHIAHDVLILTHDHGVDYRNNPIGKKLEIGINAFIGSKSIITSNCSYIGNHSVIGTGSVVTKDVPDFAIVAGNPAKIIRYKINV